MITLENKFLKFKDDFKKDTGLEFGKENMNLYVQYVTARCSDYSAQISHGLTHELLNKLNFIPGEISLKIAEMIRSHEVFKELPRKKS